MIKLYKRNWAGRRDYHEAWVSGDEVVEHWGRLGTRGESRRHPVDPSRDEAGNLEMVLAAARARGFAELDDDKQQVLLVQYEIEGIGTPADLEKRHAAEESLNELLGWTGLGHVDGGSIGSGTMEVCCYVVDFKLARDVIQRELRSTAFADYAGIIEEGS